jgi:hypothetical protein
LPRTRSKSSGWPDDEKRKPQEPERAGYWRACEKCGEVIDGPHVTSAEIMAAMNKPHVCERCAGASG